MGKSRRRAHRDEEAASVYPGVQGRCGPRCPHGRPVPGGGVPQARARAEPPGAVEYGLHREGPHDLRRRLRALGRAGADRRTGASPGAHDPGERDFKKSLEQADLTLDEKREMMSSLRDHYPMSRLCAVLDLPRSSAYYGPKPGEDRSILEALVKVAGEWTTYGYRRLTKQLQREGYIVNSKLVRRLMHELGIVGK